MTDRIVGWAFVAAQIVLLAVLILLPERGDWPTPGWLETASLALMIAGAVVVLMSSRSLGAALTPTPVPRDGATLATGGAYRWVRHPIYSGVLLIVVGLVVGSGSVVALAVGVVTVAFFTAKARWEEGRLREIHPGYGAYAAATPRFVPRVRRL